LYGRRNLERISPRSAAANQVSHAFCNVNAVGARTVPRFTSVPVLSRHFFAAVIVGNVLRIFLPRSEAAYRG
jgi:hypothetical protein